MNECNNILLSFNFIRHQNLNVFVLFLTTAIVQSLVDWTIKANAHLTKQIYASPSPFVCLKKAVKLLMNTFLKQNHIASIL